MRPATYFRNDELPAYRRRITIDGVAPDLTEDDLTLTLKPRPSGPTALVKTSGITGDAEGLITVNWTVGDLDLDPGLYDLQITAMRAGDAREWTEDDLIRIKDRSAG